MIEAEETIDGETLFKAVQFECDYGKRPALLSYALAKLILISAYQTKRSNNI